MPDSTPQAPSSHMKVTKQGRPYLKVRLFLLPQNTRFSKPSLPGYLGSFLHPDCPPLSLVTTGSFSKRSKILSQHSYFVTLDVDVFNLPLCYGKETTQDLASLKFPQSNRGQDLREPSHIITTPTTTTTFSMTREIVKDMC